MSRPDPADPADPAAGRTDHRRDGQGRAGDPPAGAEACLTRGYECRDAGSLALAERWFLAARVADPDSAGPEDALGDVLALAGRWPEAAAALARADALDPGRPYRLAQLAEALAAADAPEQAITAARRWLALVPDSVPARRMLAGQLVQLADDAAAGPLLREGVLLDPGDAEMAAALCRLLTRTGDPLAALEQVQPALRFAPDHAGLHAAIGDAWQALGESAKARAARARCLELDPADGAGVAALLAAGPAPTAGTPPDPIYVRALFDRYADRFDHELRDRLAYRAPELLLEAVRATLPERAGQGGVGGLDSLDLGCGTGLVGVVFAPFVRRLAGVDLSPRMIEQARRRALYHSLEAADLLVTLAREAGAWDLILAADVFGYLGDLGPVLAAVARALRPGGRLAATVEALTTGSPTDTGESRWEVGPSRRTRHGAGHVRAAVAAAGLTLCQLAPAVVRLERGEPVAALVLVARRPELPSGPES